VSLAGSALATELCVAGVSLDAAGARAAGLANYVVDADELDEFATSLCARLADTDRDAATETKALLLHAVSSPSGQHAAAERDALRRLRKARLGVERED
jgi:enoyl-CoA hydratase/carnithine racemase